MARLTGCDAQRRNLLACERKAALGRRSFRPSPCRGGHPSSPLCGCGSSIHSHLGLKWLKYSFLKVAQVFVPTWLRYSLTFTHLHGEIRIDRPEGMRMYARKMNKWEAAEWLRWMIRTRQEPDVKGWEDITKEIFGGQEE